MALSIQVEKEFDELSNKRLLVVGGAGFIGSNLILKLLEQAPKEVIIIDNLLSSDICNVPKNDRVTFIYGSITDPVVLAGLPKDLDYVWHLSCYHGNQSSINNPLADHENNTLTTLMLFDRLKDFKNLRKVVYAAAGCAVAEKTYGEAKATTESAPVSLYHDSPYSISKLVGEIYGNYYFLQYDFPIVKARFQNVYGPREILGAGSWRGTVHTVWRNVTPTFIWKALQNESLGLDDAGRVSRDFIFVEDIVNGLICCAVRGRSGENYNLASGVEITIRELAETINEITGNMAPLKLLPARTWDRSGRRFGSTKKSKNEIDFVARVGLRQGLEATIEWFRRETPTIQRCIAQHNFFVSQLRQGSS